MTGRRHTHWRKTGKTLLNSRRMLAVKRDWLFRTLKTMQKPATFRYLG